MGQYCDISVLHESERLGGLHLGDELGIIYASRNGEHTAKIVSGGKTETFSFDLTRQRWPRSTALSHGRWQEVLWQTQVKGTSSAEPYPALWLPLRYSSPQTPRTQRHNAAG
ncbi:hypothetical protein G7066_14320 [Leucobacter coleopterorum]|uniref:Uncharacterized protein n=1 Tax=Leucobacter coleopterorum TaxID=2714933 RepID=A0ABX6JYS5_9MICO|nr:hypothetical protein [Leucobacter coleopterorum]QIM19451.1 hypothetical protein G7066_14320 [Leucobacter coleopterorum]